VPVKGQMTRNEQTIETGSATQIRVKYAEIGPTPSIMGMEASLGREMEVKGRCVHREWQRAVCLGRRRCM